MGVSFLFFQGKTAFNIKTCHVISNISQLLPPVDIDNLEIASWSIKATFYFLGDFGQALLMCKGSRLKRHKSRVAPAPCSFAKLAIVSDHIVVHWCY